MGSTPRLKPPPELGPCEAAHFVDLVTALPATHFQPCDLPLLCRYCEAIVLAERAAVELRDGPAVIDGKPSPWISIHATATKTMLGLSLRLRLSPQARIPNQPRRSGAVSYYERAALEGHAIEAPPPRGSPWTP